MASSETSKQLLFDIAERLLLEARALGADAADVLVAESASLEAGCRLGEVEDIGRSESRDLGLRVMVGQRQAAVSSTDWSDKGLKPLAERCVAMAKLAPEDPYCGLAPQDKLATEFPELDLADEYEPSSDSLFDMAKEAEEVARGVEGVVNSNGGGAGYSRARVLLASSAGFAESYDVTSYSLSCSVVAGKDGGMETDYDHTSARHFSDMDAAANIGRMAGKRAVERLGARKVATQQVPIVLDPRLSGGLVGHLAGAISGTSIARGTSFLKDAMGTEIFPKSIRITDDPHKVRGLRSKPFDGEGVAMAPLNVIEEGRLTTWILDCATAKQLGLETTGRASRGTGGAPSPSTTNLYMAAGDVSPEDLIADIEEGFYVTTLFGQGVNGVTGDYSRGAAGFWIEKGKIAYPVNEVTVAGNLKDMFRNVTPANDLSFRYGINAPTLRIEGMTVAGS